MAVDTRCYGCNEELNAMMLLMAANDGYMICMPCVKARATAGTNGGKCVCGKRKRRLVYKATHYNNRVMREWYDCQRCLGKVNKEAAV